MALRQPLNFSPAVASSSSKQQTYSPGSIGFGRRRPKAGILSVGFCDQGHVQYYKSIFGSTAEAGRWRMNGKEVKSGKEKPLKKMKKKQLKLLKGLSRDLSTFSQMGFGLDSSGDLVDEIKGNMITEATQVLLEQLHRVRAEDKKLKKQMKKEKARSKAAARMQIGGDCKMSTSSSSSSESSDSECGDVIDMSSLNRTNRIPVEACNATVMPEPAEEVASWQPSSWSSADAPRCSKKKIEVCMGGKCKKSGAGALLEEFQRVVGMETAVSGCKCMGKCRDGPNVKVVDAFDEVATANAENNSLCIGVGLEDVNTIVSTFLGDQQLGFAAAN